MIRKWNKPGGVGCAFFLRRVLLASQLLVLSLHAQELPEIGVEALSFKAKGESFYQDKSVTVFELSYRASGDKFSYLLNTRTTRPGMDPTAFVVECAFDGKHTFEFTPDNGRLEVSAGNKRTHPEIRDLNALYYLYSFTSRLSAGDTVADVKTIALKEFAEATHLPEFLAGSRVVVEDADEVTVEGLPVMEPLMGMEVAQPVKVEVTLGKRDGMFPLRWRKVGSIQNSTKKRSIEMKVIETKEIAVTAGQMFRFPSKVTIKHYTDATLEIATSIEVSDVQVNKDVKADSYDIDPARAAEIADLDSRELIDVPAP